MGSWNADEITMDLATRFTLDISFPFGYYLQVV